MIELDAGQRLLLDQLTEEYQQRHGVAVEYLKNAVGPGQEYSNDAGRVVVSSNGVWFECMDQPMEFSGAAGVRVAHHFVTNEDALILLGSLRSLTESSCREDTRICRLFCLYERMGIVDEQGAHVACFEPDDPSGYGSVRRVGAFRDGTLPLVFRCRFDTSRKIPELSYSQGVVVCLTGLGERNLVVEMPYAGKDLRNLAHPPMSMLPQ